MFFQLKSNVAFFLGARLFVLTFILLAVDTAYPFANNNVRVDRFHWTHVQTEHFDIYYDKSTEHLVHRMAHHLENAWKDVGQAFRFQVPGRTPFFFFSNHNEFEQTNIVPIGEGTGGVTEAFKNRFLIFNDGSDEWLRHVIYHEFTHVVQFNILYGGFWKSVRLLKSPFYPLWAMEGLAEYGSGDVDEAMGDMVVRDAVAFNKLPLLAELQGFGHLKPNQVTLGYKTGEAAMHFLKDEYGEEKIHEFLLILKDHFDVSSALENLLGADLNRFDFRFHEWMKDKYDSFLKNSSSASAYGAALTSSDLIPQFNEAPVVSPDARKIYFFSDRGGPTQLFEFDKDLRETRALTGLKWRSFENIETRGRALSLSSDGRYLAFSGEKKQKDYLFIYDLKNEKLSRIRVPFDQLRSPVFSPVKDNQLVCVGMKRGVNDLYLIDRHGQVLARLTDNHQDERDPVFSRDGKDVFYSGEVIEDGQSQSAGRDIFSINLEGHEISVAASFVGRETEPEVLADGSLVFVRDRSDDGEMGYNFFHFNPKKTEDSRGFISNFTGGGFSPRFSPVDESLYFVGFENGEKHIYQGTWTFVSPVIAINDEKSDESLDVKKNASSKPILSWPSDSGSPLLLSSAKPYQFKSSTDLFLPFFLYSTQDGLVVVDVWQFSELLGNHQFQQQMQYASGSDLFDLSLFYTYARFRPQFTLGLRGVKYFRDFENQNQRREVNGVGIVSYPLDRVNSFQAGFGATDRKDTFFDESEPNAFFNDRYFIGGFEHDTVTGRYLVPTQGRRWHLFYQQGFETAGGDQEYKTGGMEAVQYFPIPRESTLASRLFYGRSVGEDAQVFRLGGVDRIRALPSGIDVNKKNNVAFASSELRLRIKYLNARTRFLFPDFFFKAAYLILFDDIGYGWDTEEEKNDFQLRRANNSAGVGISWPTFILQTFQLNLTVQWARQTNKGKDVWYITVGPSF